MDNRDSFSNTEYHNDFSRIFAELLYLLKKTSKALDYLHDPVNEFPIGYSDLTADNNIVNMFIKESESTIQKPSNMRSHISSRSRGKSLRRVHLNPEKEPSEILQKNRV